MVVLGRSTIQSYKDSNAICLSILYVGVSRKLKSLQNVNEHQLTKVAQHPVAV